jgi:dihydropteroate synthase
MIWRCCDHRFDLEAKTLVMGVLNLTPDSFSDGGRFFDHSAAVHHALRMADESADIIDIGGQSSRPGSEPVPAEEELERTCPVIARIISARPEICISIDTSKAAVARAALTEGASIVNDISGLEGDPEMLGVVAESDAGCVIMHMRGSPSTMQDAPEYTDAVGEIADYLKRRAEAARQAGIARERICIDPGIGFGKLVEHNLEILRRLNEFAGLGLPVLVGPSRKSFIGKVLGVGVDERLHGTLAACVASVLGGAAVVRVHEVKPARQAVDLARAIRRAAP